MVKQTIEEWRKEGHEKFGARGRDFKFVCPRCGNIACGQDFIDKADLSVEEAANAATKDCIGRHIEEEGCDWASYGFWGTLGKGRIVLMDGKEIEIFDFAEVIT